MKIYHKCFLLSGICSIPFAIYFFMEGPSIIILKEELQGFKGKKVTGVGGNAKIDQQRLLNQKIVDFKSWGKHFLICFPQITVRIHFLMFGSYRLNEQKDIPPRLSLKFSKGILNLYSCSVKIIEGDLDKIYDWSADVMSDEWDPQRAVRSIRSHPDDMICDVLLDQNIFAGAGNIIKNEVLFRVFLHPEAKVSGLTLRKRRQLVKAVRTYSFEFYQWKKIFQLSKHWLIYRKKKCPRCNIPVIIKHTGTGNRLSFYCSNCQLLH